MELVRDSSENLRLLSQLILAPSSPDSNSSVAPTPAGTILNQQRLHELEALACTNHVIVRAFEALQSSLTASGDEAGAEWVVDSLNREHARITHALGFLNHICTTLEAGGCPVIVMKSLDHWPDLGSDLDLFTDATPAPSWPRLCCFSISR